MPEQTAECNFCDNTYPIRKMRYIIVGKKDDGSNKYAYACSECRSKIRKS